MTVLAIDVLTIASFAVIGWILDDYASETWADRLVSAPCFGMVGLTYVVFRHLEGG
ncbi:MAG: PAM68 family protein [Acidobacteria bacterium]|nr:PAM68 family protein [Acidobacteriota bacterium]